MRFNKPGGFGKHGGAAIGKVVARHGGDDRESQTKFGAGVGYASGLTQVVIGGLALLDVAEAAAAGADIAQDNEGGGPGGIALADIGAGGLLANRVKIHLGDEVLDLAVGLSEDRFDF